MNSKIIIFIFLICAFQELISESDSLDLLGDNRSGFTDKVNNLADTTTSIMYNKKMLESLKNRDTMALFDMYCFGKDVGERNPRIGLMCADSIIRITYEINDVRSMISGYNLKGLMYTLKGDYNIALENFNKSLEVSEKHIDSLGKKILDKYGITYFYLGNLYMNRNEYKTALLNYNKANDLFNQFTQRDYQIEDSLIKKVWGRFPYTTYKNDKLSILYSIANTYNKLEDLDKSNDYIDSCDMAESNYNDHNFNAKLLYLKSLNFYKEGEIDSVTLYLNQALEISLYMNYYEYQVYIYDLRYQILKNISDIDSGIVSASKINMKSYLSKFYKIKSDWFAEKGDYKNSHQFLSKHLGIKEILNDENKAREFGKLESDLEYKSTIKNLEYEQELAKNKQEISSQRQLIMIIAIILTSIVILLLVRFISQRKSYIRIIESKQSLLETSNIELTLSKEKLSEMNLAKIKLFGIISHDLKNPIKEFQIGTSKMLNSLKTQNTMEIGTDLAYLNNLSSKISELLLSLLDWSKSQINQDVVEIDNIDSDKLVNNIVNFYNDYISNKSLLIHRDLYISNFYSSYSTCEIILRNIVHNAIKFSNTHGQINISNMIEDGYVIFKVEDYGIGISEDNITKINNLELPEAKEGVGFAKSSGLGLLKVQELLNQIGGNLIIEQNNSTGTIVYVYIKNQNTIN
jgi:signal transduction histidine kinase